MCTPNGTVGGYTHNNGSYGALVAAEASTQDKEALQQLARSLDQIAQHIVAIDPAEGDGAAEPLKYLLTQVGLRPRSCCCAASSPSHFLQPYVLDSKQTVGDKLAKDSKAAKIDSVHLTDYTRWRR